MSENIRRDLEHLADSHVSGPRGADLVWRAAAADAAATPLHRRPMLAAGAIAAVVLAVAGITTMVTRDNDQKTETAQAISTSTTGRGVAGSGSSGGIVGGGATDGTTIVPGAVGVPPTNPQTSGGTTPGGTAPPPQLPRTLATARLQPFASCGDYVGTSRAKALELVGPWGVPGLGDSGYATGVPSVGGEDTAGGAPAQPGAAPSESLPRTASSDEYSNTNVQEAGVDEPDSVKTDGRRILTIAQGRLWYLALDGTTPRVAGSLTLDGGWGSELLVAGDRALVIQTQAIYPLARGGGGGVAASDSFAPYPVTTRQTLAIVDVSTPAMKVVKTISVDGMYVAARMIGGVARVVVRSSPQNFEWSYPTDQSAQAEAAATEKNRDVVRRSPDSNWLPTLTIADGGGHTTASRSVVACDAAMHPQQFSGFGVITVLTVDPARPEGVDAATVQADGEQVYASATGLYVATTAWDHVAPADGTPQIVQAPDTLIHKFAIDDPGKARYLVSGRVRGTALNQFSFSEHEGRLRVATTSESGNGSESYVTVLADRDGALTQAGQVGGLGRGERIYAVRFIGDTGYVVTFRQIDPLYVVDLSDAARPRVAGELKIAGYSAYLHPIGDGLLIGIGQDASEEGRTTGTQVSVFDVSNPANPTRLHQVKLGQGSSTAEFDHHAFLWWAKTNLAVVPFASYDPQSGGQTFNGAVGLTAGRGALGEKGRIQHPADERAGGAPAQISRSIVVGETLFTLSEFGILASALVDLSPRAYTRFG